MIDIVELTATRHSLRSTDLVYRIARSSFELAGFWRLRRQIFCIEQGIFPGTDVDEHDDAMIPIVCTSLIAGMEDEVVGVVRIDEREPGVWWGSRLGVHPRFRCVRSGSRASLRTRQPRSYAQRSVGAGLIYKAVSTARALGSTAFFAHVQRQNAAFFAKLGWTPIEEIRLHSIPHVKMEADLDLYPPVEHDLDLRYWN